MGARVLSRRLVCGWHFSLGSYYMTLRGPASSKNLPFLLILSIVSSHQLWIFWAPAWSPSQSFWILQRRSLSLANLLETPLQCVPGSPVLPGAWTQRGWPCWWAGAWGVGDQLRQLRPRESWLAPILCWDKVIGGAMGKTFTRQVPHASVLNSNWKISSSAPTALDWELKLGL